ncbi:helix-turn-helix domain-containing protein [Chryseobacterium wangxinyae]|uniref:winged helix-turn-helix transcriptional regulator n=1 Tax=Chryseobacterium sp. CY350 TaxID=2997336 RepID=UPI00226FF278|nr:helix-turn-helix domain-containing protein [Chryseobacterium sp. CY350]MCY0979308.1 helix-turn-helix domain-containing protein [Chryseobacterium sp. CY350]WBZ95940.1 helix-turn-helix domain-containing protein [Chryseobacterium sp. CY350]
MEQKFDLTKDCSQKILAISDTMEILNGKWKMSIIACLCYKPMRYSELLKEVKGISGKMLSRELKDLEINELIERHVLNTAPVAVEYKITDYGKSLKQLTNTIADWGFIHRQRIISGMKSKNES